MLRHDCLAGWQRDPAVAIALAEMCFLSVQQQPIKSSRHKQRHTTSHSKHDQLLQSCIANVGIFEAALLMQRSADFSEAASADSLQGSEAQQATASQPTAPNQPSPHFLLVRYYWLGGRISEHLKQYEDAAQQYEACKAALSTLSDITLSAQAEPVGSGPLTLSQVDSSLARLRMVTMVEDGRKSIEQGQQSELIARLSPVLLAGATDKVALEVPEHLAGLELLQVLLGSVSLSVCLSVCLSVSQSVIAACPEDESMLETVTTGAQTLLPLVLVPMLKAIISWSSTSVTNQLFGSHCLSALHCEQALEDPNPMSLYSLSVHQCTGSSIRC